MVALTGTPGTGKTSIARVLAKRGHAVLPLSRFVGDPRFDLGSDLDRDGTTVIDEEALDEHLRLHLDEELWKGAGQGQGTGQGQRQEQRPEQGERTEQEGGVDETTLGLVFIESHFAHMLTVVDRIIVLRCRPSVLQKRLDGREYPPEKVRENLEAEGMDLILQEAVQVRDDLREQGHRVLVGEVDTTDRSVEECVDEVLSLAQEESANLEIGRVDWSDEVLGWY